MTVYVDDAYLNFGRMLMCHMISDASSVELHEMARRIGVRRIYCQFEGSYKEHYDVSKSMRARAVQFGAVQITSRELGKMIRDRQRGPVDVDQRDDPSQGFP